MADDYGPVDPATIRKWTCAHTETTHDDGEGWALCLGCGAAIAVRLTRKMLREAMDRMMDGR